MFIIQEIASALIAGVMVVMADLKNAASASPQNQANCTRQKICTVGCDVLQGVCT